ncbi:hypothetical protein COO60DRAFT_1560224 [Scenedesmus sp. NREL 46B-D3]|nr:hypothetical protein COO60DRAFT_1560224 [Scenedesmus sp. NREL 46B-D3]
MIGYAAATQSAQQVSAMLGGPPASDRRVQDQLNELLASKSRPELWEVLRLLKEFLGGDRQAASQYFAERPGLTKAVFQAQVLLGESGARASRLGVTAMCVQCEVDCCSSARQRQGTQGGMRPRGGMMLRACRNDMQQGCCHVCMGYAGGGCSVVAGTDWLWPRERSPSDLNTSLSILSSIGCHARDRS